MLILFTTTGIFHVSLVIFDLDNTLIADDSDYLWGQFLVSQGMVNRTHYELANQRFYEDYKHGTLDINEFLAFALKPLAEININHLFRLREQFIKTVIQPILLKPARNLINHHKTKGDTLIVITATNKFVTEPIVNLYGIDNLLATVPECKQGRFTGRVAGIPCFQGGKVKLLNEWLITSKSDLNDSWFYSDSHNDLPLLNTVDNPVAVDPDDKLRNAAEKQRWPIISLRE